MEKNRMSLKSLKEAVMAIGGGHYATLRCITPVDKLNKEAKNRGIEIFCDCTRTVRIGAKSNDNLKRVAEYKENNEVGKYTCEGKYEYTDEHRFKHHKESGQEYLVYFLDGNGGFNERHYFKVENGIETEVTPDEVKELRQPSAYKSYGIASVCGETEKQVKVQNVVSITCKDIK